MVAFLAFVGALVALGIDVVLPALDRLRAEFGLSEGAGQASLVVTGYFLGLALGQVVYGPFADRFGRRPVLTAGLTVYALAALAAAIAPSFGALLAVRVVWGLGSASCAALFPAMARDLYGGDRLAGVMQLVMAVFLIGPVAAPFIGELLLLTGWWRSVFAVGVAFSTAAMLWLRSFGETLPPERRRPLDLGTVAQGFQAAFGTRPTLRYTAAMAFSDSGFYVHLGASPFIIDEVFGLGRWFALIFAVFSLIIGAGLLAARRVTFRFGARRTATVASLGIASSGAVFTAVALASGGRPEFWAWFALVLPSLICMTVIRPTCVSLALEPLERMAGTASGVIGMTSQGTGALLAAVVTSRISETVTPMAVGFLLYGALTAALVALGHRAAGPVAVGPVDDGR